MLTTRPFVLSISLSPIITLLFLLIFFYLWSCEIIMTVLIIVVYLYYSLSPFLFIYFAYSSFFQCHKTIPKIEHL